MRNVLSLVAVAALLAVSACAAAPVSQPRSAQTTQLQRLADFTLSDLQAASTDAHAHNDTTAFQCYDYLIGVIPTIQPSSGATTVGAVLAFQHGRDIANGLGGAQSQLRDLNLACAPLVIDSQTLINKLLLIGVGGVAVLP